LYTVSEALMMIELVASSAWNGRRRRASRPTGRSRLRPGRAGRRAREHAAQHLGQLRRFRVLQVDDTRAADGARRHIQFLDERAQERDAPRVVRAQQDAVGAPIRHHREAVAARGDLRRRRARHASGLGDARPGQAHHKLREVDGGGVLNRDHRDLGARRLVDLLDDAQ